MNNPNTPPTNYLFNLEQFNAPRTAFMLFLAIFSLLGLASAACEGHITFLGVKDLIPGDELSVVIDVAIPSSLGVRDLDVWLEDPDNREISVGKLQLSNDTSAIESNLDITDHFLDGGYTIYAKVSVYEHGNITEFVCSEQISTDFNIETDRRSYSGVTLELVIKEEYQTYSYNTTKEISYGEGTFPVILSVKNVPMDIELNIEDFNFTVEEPGEINIDPGTPMYSYGTVDALNKKLNACIWSLLSCEENNNRTITDIASGCKNSMDFCTSIQVQMQNLQNISDKCGTELTTEMKRTAELKARIDETDAWFGRIENKWYFWMIMGLLTALGIAWSIAFSERGIRSE